MYAECEHNLQARGEDKKGSIWVMVGVMVGVRVMDVFIQWNSLRGY